VAARREPTARLRPTPSEDPLIDLDAAVSANLGPIVIVLTVVLVVLIIAVVALARRIRSLDARLRGLTRGDDGDLEDVLGAHLDRVHALGREVERLVARTGRLESGAPRAFQRVGLVRFNPFEDTGGNQSFALALLDAAGNGWVLSSLHARSGTRVYAKAIREGRGEAALSEEEAAAIKQATA
jgi:HAMP domain-containing protein